MSYKTLLLILFSVSMSAVAQIVMKVGMSDKDVQRHFVTEQGVLQTLFGSLTNGYVVTGLALYGISALSWLFVLAGIDVSKAYPFVGLGFVFTMVLGWLLLNESIGGARVLGTLFVVVGVVMVART